MKIKSAQLFDAYEKALSHIESEPTLKPAFAPVEAVFESKKTQADAVIMIYGVYNAGKSTLINMLLGKEEAATDDIPLTDKVSAYRWENYTILDTPGVDAPIEHENVTKAQMLKADAIIFVVDPLGTVEEAKTLEVLVDLHADHKQVFLVFNEKKLLSDEDFIKLKSQVREQMQIIAADRGVPNIISEVPVVRINAKRALLGQLKDKSELVELSGYPTFKQQLTAFLDGISSDDIYSGLKHKLVDFLNMAVEAQSGGDERSDAVKRIDNFMRRLIREKPALVSELARDIGREGRSIAIKVKQALRGDAPEYQSRIEKILNHSNTQIELHLNNRLQDVATLAQDEIEQLQATIPAGEAYAHAADASFQKPDPSSNSSAEPSASGRAGLSAQALAEASKQLGSFAKPEHIVEVLAATKKILPSLMKGIGRKTMEKWGTAVAGKWLPYVGTAVTIGQALWDIFADDPEEKAMRKQNEEQRRARERAEQQLQDVADEVATGFEQFMLESVSSRTDAFFSQLHEQAESLRRGFSDAEIARSRRLQAWVTIQQQALSA